MVTTKEKLLNDLEKNEVINVFVVRNGVVLETKLTKKGPNTLWASNRRIFGVQKVTYMGYNFPGKLYTTEIEAWSSLRDITFEALKIAESNYERTINKIGKLEAK